MLDIILIQHESERLAKSLNVRLQSDLTFCAGRRMVTEEDQRRIVGVMLGQLVRFCNPINIHQGTDNTRFQ